MIFLTGMKVCSDLRLLWGVLLDPITPEDFPQSAFKAFLVSDTVREVTCEVPKYHGGHGTTPDGLFVAEFETELRGLCVYAYERQPWVRLLTDAVENRISLVTRDATDDVVFPAFLAAEQVTPPTGDRVVGAIEI